MPYPLKNFLIALIILIIGNSSVTRCIASARSGTAADPLRVMLIPADGGTEDGTRRDFLPLFEGITRASGIHFEVRVGQSYAAVVEGMSGGIVELAWFGPASYLQAKERGAAELLAVAEKDGGIGYYSGIFVKKDGPIHTIADLRGRSIALGDVSSASSFVYPVAALLENQLDPVRDFSRVVLSGNHSSSIQALRAGQVDAAACSLLSFAKAARENSVDPEDFRLLLRTEEIPGPPLAMHPQLSPDLKAKLKESFASARQLPGVQAAMVRGYGGGIVDGYKANVSEDVYEVVGRVMKQVTPELKSALLEKAGNP